MGRPTHLRRRPDPSPLTTPIPFQTMKRDVGARLLAAAGVVAAALVAAAASGAAGSLGLRLDRALHAPAVSYAHSGAEVVDLSTGAVVYAHNATAAAAAGLQREADGDVCRADGARPRRSGSRRTSSARASRTGPRGTGDLVLKGYGDPTLSVRGARRPRTPGARGRGDHRHRARARRRDVVRRAAHRPGLEGGVLPQRVAAAVGAHRRPRRSFGGRTSRNPALSAAQLFAKALARAGVRVAHHGRARRGRRRGRRARVRRLAAARSRWCTSMDQRQRQLHRGDAREGARRGAARTRDDRRRPSRRLRPARCRGDPARRRPARRRLGALALRPAHAGFPRRPAPGDAGRPGDAARARRVPSRSRAAPGRCTTGCAAPPPPASCARRPGTTDNSTALSGFAGDRYVFSVIVNGDPCPGPLARRRRSSRRR